MTPAEKAARRRANDARYNASPKGQARYARHRASARWRETRPLVNARHNARRLLIGRRYIGSVKTDEHAAGINAHIKDRLHEFISRFSTGTQAEGV